MEEAITGAEATMAPEDNKAPRATAAPEKSRTPATTDTLTTTTNTLSSPAKTGSSPVRDGSQDQRRKVSLTKYDGRQQIKSRAPSRRGRSKYKLPTTESNPLVIDEDSSGNPSLDKKAAGTVETGAKKSESPTHSASKKVSPPGKTVPSEDQPSEPENAKPGHDGTRLSKRLSSSGRVKKPGGTKQKGSRSSK